MTDVHFKLIRGCLLGLSLNQAIESRIGEQAYNLGLILASSTAEIFYRDTQRIIWDLIENNLITNKHGPK